MKATCFFILTFLLFQNGRSQCLAITITGKENTIQVKYNKDDRLSMISGKGDDDDEGQHAYYFTTTPQGVAIPAAGQKEIRSVYNEKGNFILVMGEENHTSTFKFDANHIIYWDYVVTESDQVNRKNTSYTYDQHGNLVKMVWDGTIDKTTDHGELTATYNLSKPDVLMKGGPMRFIAEMGWTIFPMSNSNQLTGWSYTQTITIPERKIITGKDKETGQDIVKTIPAKSITGNYFRNFTYTYNSNQEVTGIQVVSGTKGSAGKTQRFDISYNTTNSK